jgi:hypothetical protein
VESLQGFLKLLRSRQPFFERQVARPQPRAGCCPPRGPRPARGGDRGRARGDGAAPASEALWGAPSPATSQARSTPAAAATACAALGLSPWSPFVASTTCEALNPAARARARRLRKLRCLRIHPSRSPRGPTPGSYHGPAAGRHAAAASATPAATRARRSGLRATAASDTAPPALSLPCRSLVAPRTSGFTLPHRCATQGAARIPGFRALSARSARKT